MSPITEDFTLSQARDLARFFLGPEWTAARSVAGRCVLSTTGNGGDQRHISDNWRSAFRGVGVKLPFRKVYVSRERNVFLEDESVASCKSNSFATLVANALNVYTPDRRGQ